MGTSDAFCVRKSFIFCFEDRVIVVCAERWCVLIALARVPWFFVESLLLWSQRYRKKKKETKQANPNQTIPQLSHAFFPLQRSAKRVKATPTESVFMSRARDSLQSQPVPPKRKNPM